MKADSTHVALLQLLDARANLVDHAHKLVAEDVALLERDNLAVVQVEVGPADGRAGHLEHDIVGLGDGRNADVHDLDLVRPLPSERLHGAPVLAGLVVVLDDAARGGAHGGLRGVAGGLHCGMWL